MAGGIVPHIAGAARLQIAKIGGKIKRIFHHHRSKTMACRGGITTNIKKSEKHWKNQYPSMISWSWVEYGPYETKEEAQVIEKALMRRYGRKAMLTESDPAKQGDKWYAYKFVYSHYTERKGALAEKIDNATRQHLDLDKVELQGEDLSGLNLLGASLNRAKLNNTNLSGTNLCYAKMQKAMLFSAALQKADLESADLEGADMRNVDFCEANLWETNLEKANLKGAILSHAENLENANFANAVYDQNTKFPADFNPEKAGMKSMARY